MSATLSPATSTEGVAKVARSLRWSVQLTYGLASRCLGQFVLEHESDFGSLSETVLGSEEALKALLNSIYGGQNLWAFQSASEALASFNTAFMALETLSGLATAGEQLAGYFLGGPVDHLLRAIRDALTSGISQQSDVQEATATVTAMAEQLKVALDTTSDDERAAVCAEAEKLSQGPYSSLEEVTADIDVTLHKRDARAVAFVALAMAGWEPDLEGWDQNVASCIRGETLLKGQYHIVFPLTRSIQQDILVGMSLERRNVAFALDGTPMLRVQTFHINQDAAARYVPVAEVSEESRVATSWAPFERTRVLAWETVKEFISQTGPIRYEWTSNINRIKEIGRACVLMGGLETGEVFLSMSANIKANSPRIYHIWEKTISQMSFVALTCVAMSTAAARAAVIERMAVSTVTNGSCYHIGAHPIYLRVENRTARLFDSEGNMVFVDGVLETLSEREVVDIGVKFFALLTRAMDGGVIKPGFYQDGSRHASVLRARGPREGFDRRDEVETESSSTKAWRRLCQSPFAPRRRDES